MAQNFCNKCGTQLADNAKVCHKCGTPAQQQAGGSPATGIPAAGTPVGQQPAPGSNLILTNNLFLEKDERQMAVLSRGTIGTLIAGGGLGRNFVILSDRRLYESGRKFRLKTLSLSQYLEIVPLEAISAMGYHSQSSIGPILMAISSLIAAIIGIGIGGDEGLAGAIGGFVSAVFFVVLFLLLRKRFFRVSTSSGEVSLNFKIYGEEQIRQFSNKLGNVYTQRLKVILEKS